MFDKKGQIIIDKEECEMDADELMMLALDAGAEDFSEEEDSYEVYTAPEDFSAVRETLEKEGVPMLEADVTMIPQTWTELTDEESIKKMNRILDLLDEMCIRDRERTDPYVPSCNYHPQRHRLQRRADRRERQSDR